MQLGNMAAENVQSITVSVILLDIKLYKFMCALKSGDGKNEKASDR